MSKSLLLALVCAFSAPLPSLIAQPAPAANTSEKETALEEKMNAVRSSFNKLRKQVADPAANASSLELAGKLRKAAEESVSLIPARAADLPEAERTAFIAAYETKMKTFVAEVAKLEAALQAGKNDEAAAIVAKLGALQKDGHKEFRKPKKE